jgi:hypothetical protein
MALSHTAIPASVRAFGQKARFSHSSVPGAPKPFLVTPVPTLSPQHSKLVGRVDAIAASAMTARTLRLPQEPEDAKMTGVTRSLNRRLLGLNVGGSLMRSAS